MIIGIGIDLVECNRFLDWSAFKKQRIFTKKELEYADNDNANSEKHLANFWAAREAFLKAIGTGFGDDIAFSDVSVALLPQPVTAVTTKPTVAAKHNNFLYFINPLSFIIIKCKMPIFHTKNHCKFHYNRYLTENKGLFYEIKNILIIL